MSLITNLVFFPDPVTNFTFKLPAPMGIGPANGVGRDLVPGAQGAAVKFEWTPVADGDFKTMNAAASPAYGPVSAGTNFWKVAAVVKSLPLTRSATRSFIFK